MNLGNMSHLCDSNQNTVNITKKELIINNNINLISAWLTLPISVCFSMETITKDTGSVRDQRE